MTKEPQSKFAGKKDLHSIFAPLGRGFVEGRILTHPEFPKPVIGGQKRGQRALWSRDEVEVFRARLLMREIKV